MAGGLLTVFRTGLSSVVLSFTNGPLSRRDQTRRAWGESRAKCSVTIEEGEHNSEMRRGIVAFPIYVGGTLTLFASYSLKNSFDRTQLNTVFPRVSTFLLRPPPAVQNLRSGRTYLSWKTCNRKKAFESSGDWEPFSTNSYTYFSLSRNNKITHFEFEPRIYIKRPPPPPPPPLSLPPRVSALFRLSAPVDYNKRNKRTGLLHEEIR